MSVYNDCDELLDTKNLRPWILVPQIVSSTEAKKKTHLDLDGRWASP